MLLDNGDTMQVLINVVCGGMFFSAGVHSLRLWSNAARTNDEPEAAPPVVASASEPVQSELPPDLPPEPPPEGYLAALGKKRTED